MASTPNSGHDQPTPYDRTITVAQRRDDVLPSAALTVGEPFGAGVREPRRSRQQARRTRRRSVAIVGAGLTGAALAIVLARRGYAVKAFDLRDDPRCAVGAEGASISLTLTERGLEPLARIGLAEKVLNEIATPLATRAVHDASGRVTRMPYGVRKDEVLQAVPRARLSRLLVEAAASEPGVELFFGQRCVNVDRDAGRLTLADAATGRRHTVTADLIVGADGIHSAVRTAIHHGSFGSFSKEFVEWRYKEITVDGGDREPLDPHALHVWPRGDRMMFALPNKDGINAVCVLPAAGPGSFAAVRTPEDVRLLFRDYFPDIEPYMPHLVEEVLERPARAFATVRTSLWHYRDKVVILGDAAHAVVPFLGQGANAGFEDLLVLDRAIAEHWHDLEAALEQFERERRPNAEALADLSLANFEELRDTVRRPLLGARKQVALSAYRRFGAPAAPLYSLVAHSTTPYAECITTAKQRERLARRLGADVIAAGIVAYGGLRDLARTALDRDARAGR